MKKTTIFAMVLTIAKMMLLNACSNNGDSTPPLPPDSGTNTQPQEWGEVEPFYLLDNVESMTIGTKTEDGFLYNSSHNCDYFVLEYDLICSPTRKALKGNAFISFNLTFNGDKLSPVENVERYNNMCKAMGAKPLCSLNDETTLVDLPFYVLRRNHTMETATKIEAFTDKNFETGASATDGMMPTSTVGFIPSASKTYIEKYLNNLAPGATSEGICTTRQSGDRIITDHANCITWFDAEWGVQVVMPNEPGVYNITIRITLANGKVLEDSVKIKFVAEGTEYPA